MPRTYNLKITLDDRTADFFDRSADMLGSAEAALATIIEASRSHVQRDLSLVVREMAEDLTNGFVKDVAKRVRVAIEDELSPMLALRKAK